MGHIYKKVQVRPRSLLRAEIRREAEKEVTPQYTDNLVFYETIFHYLAGKNTAIYYDFEDLAQDPLFAVHYFNRHPQKFEELVRESEGMIQELELATSQKTIDIVALRELLKKNLALQGLLIIQAGNKFSDKRLAELALQARKKTDYVDYKYFDVLQEEIKRRLPSAYKEYVEFLLFSEIMSKSYPDKRELQKRAEEYIYFEGRLYSNKGLKDFFADNDFVLGEEEVEDGIESITGTIACPGKVSGIVRVVMEIEDLVKIKDGDIMVTPMTNPNYMTALNRVGGIITDEGGITCHAAIVARELKKPCIIGTKIATKVFKDGDQVEVDADKGVVRIIK